MDKDKKYYAAHVGSLDQIAYARKSILTDGKACGMNIIDVNNSKGLFCTLTESRCLDIARLSYKGVNIGFLSKAELVSPQNFSAVSGEFTRHFPGGMLYTCGLSNIGPVSQKNGEILPIHGRIGMTPAQDVSSLVDWENDEIKISGKMRLASLFGQNLVLNRQIIIPLSDNRIDIKDTITNEGFVYDEIMLLYHFNFGYPMLSEHFKLNINDINMEPRDKIAESGMDNWSTFEKPEAGRPEEVFYHNPKNEKDDLIHVKLENNELNIGAEIVFDKKNLPQLIQWKSMMSGDYALGIEPATARVSGYQKEKQAGRIVVLKAGEQKEYRISLRLTDLI